MHSKQFFLLSVSLWIELIFFFCSLSATGQGASTHYRSDQFPAEAKRITSLKDIVLQDSHIIDFFGAPIDDFTIRGCYVYVAQGHKLSVLDISDPTHPHTIFTKLFQGEFNALQIHGNALYLIMPYQLLVLDISAPANPKIHSSLDISTRDLDAKVMGDLLLIEGRSSPVTYDIRHSLKPQYVDTAICYATDGTQMFQYGLSPILHKDSLNNPGRLLSTTQSLPAMQNGYFTLHVGHPILGDGRLTSFTLPFEAQSDTFWLSNPSFVGDPKPANSWADMKIERAGDIILATGSEGYKVYAKPDWEHPVLECKTRDPNQYPKPTAILARQTLYALEPGRIRIFDMRDPQYPRDCGVIPGLVNPEKIKVSGKLAIIYGEGQGLHFYDISNPLRPIRRSTLPTFPIDEFLIQISGKRAYIHEKPDRLKILDLSHPTKPRLLGQMNLPKSTRLCKAIGSMLYVAEEKQLSIFDLSNPKSPHLCGMCALPEDPQAIALLGKSHVILAAPSGLQIIDISISTHPHLIGCYQKNNDSPDLAVHGSMAYLQAGIDTEAEIIDCANPSSPVRIGSTEDANMVFNGKMAFSRNFEGEINILDLSIPSSPRLVTTIQDEELPVRKLDLAYPYLLTTWRAGNTFGVKIYDVSTPSRPKILTTIEEEYQCYDAAAYGKYGYVTERFGGLMIFRME